MLRVRSSLFVVAGGLLFAVGCAPAASPATATATVPRPQPPTTAPVVSASPSVPVVAPSPSASAAVASAVTVQMTDTLKFDPASVTVPRGATVTWHNTSQLQHTVTDDPSKAASAADASLPSGVQPWDSGNIDPAHDYTHTFDVPGTYKYFCQPHEAAGMVGTVIVTP